MKKNSFLLFVSISFLSIAVLSVQGAQQPVKPSGAIYSIVTRNRTPMVNPSGKLEIEFYLSGYGTPEKAKLNIQWSSPYVISEKPGRVTYCLEPFFDKAENQWKSALITDDINPTGELTILDKRFFKEMPSLVKDPKKEKEAAEAELRPVRSEYSLDRHPPILWSINIASNAPSGDYDVALTLTYGNEQNLRQDYKTVPFHITSWWERNQGWVTPIGVSIAFLSLLIATIGIIYRVSHPE